VPTPHAAVGCPDSPLSLERSDGGNLGQLQTYVLVVITSSADGTSLGGDTGPQIGAFLGDGSSDVLSLHLTLGVDDDTGVVLEVEEETFSAAEGLALADNDGGHHLLTELGLTLLHGGEEHITDGTGGEAVEAGTESGDGDHVQVLGASVVSAIHDGCHGETVRDL
jgi:hypothetical protein